jgi:hypothetical protein
MTLPTYQELETKLQDLYEGRAVVTPCNSDHAYNMLVVAGAYIHHDKHSTWEILLGEEK